MSLSRSADEVLVAVTRLGPVGVDLEAAVTDDFAEFDDVALAAAERTAIAALPPAERPGGRAIIWARKEALLKATGHGLLKAPDEVELSPPFTEARLVAWHGDADGPEIVHLLDLAFSPGRYGAVAVLSEDRPDLAIRNGGDLLDRR